MDLDHAASLLPLALGILAALVTIYPPNGRHRHIWAAVFAIAGVFTSVIIWFSVSTSQEFQSKVIANITGGDNYCFLWPYSVSGMPFGEYGFTIRKIKDTPLFDIDVEIDIATTVDERKEQIKEGKTVQFEKTIFHENYRTLRGELTATDIKLGIGYYNVFISQRNGIILQTIIITKDESKLHLLTKVIWNIKGGTQKTVLGTSNYRVCAVV